MVIPQLTPEPFLIIQDPISGAFGQPESRESFRLSGVEGSGLRVLLIAAC